MNEEKTSATELKPSETSPSPGSGLQQTAKETAQTAKKELMSTPRRCVWRPKSCAARQATFSEAQPTDLKGCLDTCAKSSSLMFSTTWKVMRDVSRRSYSRIFCRRFSGGQIL